jgi:hypothetical protein
MCLNVYACKLECGQATITRNSKRSYNHEGELEYVIETVIIIISARLIARERFGAMRASAVKIADVKPHQVSEILRECLRIEYMLACNST